MTKPIDTDMVIEMAADELTSEVIRSIAQGNLKVGDVSVELLCNNFNELMEHLFVNDEIPETFKDNMEDNICPDNVKKVVELTMKQLGFKTPKSKLIDHVINVYVDSMLEDLEDIPMATLENMRDVANEHAEETGLSSTFDAYDYVAELAYTRIVEKLNKMKR